MVVYKAEFPNGKVYIGKTKDFEWRKLSHSYSINHKGVTKMKRAIIKYGFESIKWNIIFETDDNILLGKKEKEFIKLFDSINNGYNISTGGDGGDTISNNSRREDIIRQQLKSKGINSYITIDDDLSSKIKEDYIINKLSINKISKKYKVSHQRLTRFLKSENVEIDTYRCIITNSIAMEKEVIDRIVNLFKVGKTINDISDMESLTIMITSRILHDSGVRESKRFKNGKRYDGKQPKKRQFDNKIG